MRVGGACTSAVLCVVTIVSCASENSTYAPTPSIRPSYHEDVRPILAAHCVECHHAEDSVTQMISLSTYEDAVAAAPLVNHQVSEHGMPLWGVDNSGACGTFSNARWLDADALDTIVKWVDRGTPQGDAARAAPLQPSPHVSPPLAHVDATLDPGASYTPSLGPGVVRCFVVDPALATDRLLTAVEIAPARPWSVEQVTVWSLDTDEAEAAAKQLDGEDDVPGYACLANPRVPNARLLVGTSWIDAGGTWRTRMPNDVGVRMKAGRKVVMQVHYNPISGMEPDRSVMRLELSDTAREACWASLDAGPFILEPGKDLVVAQGSASLGRDVQVHGVYPRMRFLGKKMHVDSPAHCLADVYRWNQHGLQHLYAYAGAQSLDGGETFRVACTYTTLGLDAVVKNGDGDYDEECSLQLLATPCAP